MTRGFFIALEGIDGAGTSSQMAPVAHALRCLGHEVTLTAEPSGGPAGLLAREALQGRVALSEAALALLFAADRLHHVATGVAPHLAAGHIVLTDRYLLSSYAYQSTALGLDWVQSINRYAPPPDAHLYFRVSGAVAKQRRAARGGPVERFDADARQSAVAQRYEALISGPAAVPHVHLIDAEQNIAAVTQQVVSCVTRLLAARAVPTSGPAASDTEPAPWH